MSTTEKKVGRLQKIGGSKLGNDSQKDSKSSKSKKEDTLKPDELEETLWTEPAHLSAEESEDDSPEYEVEQIIDKKIKRGTVYYKVKWKGFSLDDTTWEPQDNLSNAPLKITEYENQLLKKTKGPEALGKDNTPKAASETKALDATQKAKGNTKEGAGVNKTTTLSLEPETVIGKRPREKLEKFEGEDAKEIEKGVQKKIKKVTEKKDGSNKEEESSQSVENKKSKKENKISNEDKSLRSPEKATRIEEKSRKSEKTSRSEEKKKQPEEKTKVSEGANLIIQDKTKSEGKQKTSGKGEDELTFKIKKLMGNDANSSKIEIEEQSQGKDNMFEEKKISDILGNSLTVSYGDNPNQPNDGIPKVKQTLANQSNNSVSTSMADSSSLTKKDEGLSLSKIMQDEKLMEFSESEDLNRSDKKGTDKKDTLLEHNKLNDVKTVTKLKKKGRGEYGSLEKGDVPFKVVGIRPVKEENDLEVIVCWKARENGIKPYDSKVMRIDLLKRGHWIPLIEYYESKMKLESTPNFDPNALPKY